MMRHGYGLRLQLVAYGAILLLLYSPVAGQSRDSLPAALSDSEYWSVTGSERSYLASEDAFSFVKGLEQKNLIIPVVGDFAGPRALRAVGAFLRQREATVTAFYVSNVEMYLQQNGVWPAFCANVAAMPLDVASVFIRPNGARSDLLKAIIPETAGCRSAHLG